MNRLLKSLFALVVVSVLMMPDFNAAVPTVNAETGPMTMASCRDNQRAIRPGDLDQRATFAIELHCTALVNNYFTPERYEDCALKAYDLRLQSNRSVSAADMDGFEATCRVGQTGAAASSTSSPTSSNPSTTASSSPSGSSTGVRSNSTMAPLVFTAQPGDKFVGGQVGLTTEPLKDYYVNPLLLVNDRQTAFRVLINFFLGLVGAIAILFIVFNGFRYAASRGEDAQISQAKKGILYSVIGLIIILAAYTIVATILNFGAQPTPGNINAGIGITF